MTGQPEPCISGRCFSPQACGGFGYCRDRNQYGMPTEATADQWRNVATKMRQHPASKEDIEKRLAEHIAGWPVTLPPHAFVQVRADLVTHALTEIQVLRAEKMQKKATL